MGKRKVAGKFECGKTQIQSILLLKEEIIKDYEANVSSKTKWCRGANNHEIEKNFIRLVPEGKQQEHSHDRANDAGKSEANWLCVWCSVTLQDLAKFRNIFNL